MQIKPLTVLDEDRLQRIMSGYVSDAKYAVSHTESDLETIFRLKLVTLDTPYVKQYSHLDDATLAEYRQTLDTGFSLGVYEDDLLVGIALVSPQHWNKSLWVQEFHIAESHHSKGIGRALMQAVIAKSRTAKFRIIVCETQNTNVPAIRFYRHMGFSIESVDLSLYTNHDYPDGEVAVFMKRTLP